MIITKFNAIQSLVGGQLSGTDDGSIINYDDGQTPPSDAEIDTEVIRLQAEYDALAWKRSREAEFPSVQDLVVALYDTDDKSAVVAKRASIKAKYPKPTE